MGKHTRACSVLHPQCHDESEGELAGLDPYRTPEIHDKGIVSEVQLWPVSCAQGRPPNLSPVIAEGKYEWEHAYIKKATAVAQVRHM
jgi:hypothetical protein